MESLVYETNLQMVAELTGYIFNAVAQISNDSVMLPRVIVLF
jgi:hypothetical protein